MTATWVLGIDFGTTSTVIAARRGDRSPEIIEVQGERRTPSLVFIDGAGRTVVGRSAEALGATSPDRLIRAPKGRLGSPTAAVLGGRPYPIVELVGALLRSVYDEAVRSHGSEPAEVRLTHPASWNSPRRSDLLAAARSVGLPNPILVPEPVAAAIAYASEIGIEPGSHVMVYDLGGGTFDSVVLRATGDAFTIVGRPVGDPQLGGELFDELLMNHIGEQLDADTWEQLQVSDEPLWLQAAGSLRSECRRVKELLSGHEVAEVHLALPNGIANRAVSRTELEDLIRPHVEETVRLMHQCLADAGLTADDLAAVYLVGGASRSPLVLDVVQTGYPGVTMSRRGDPKAVVALGATDPRIDPRQYNQATTDPGTTRIETGPSAAGTKVNAPVATAPPTGPPPVGPPPGGNGRTGPGMPPPVPVPPSQPGAQRRRRTLVGAVAVAAVVIGGVVWVAGRDSGESNAATSTTSPTAVSDEPSDTSPSTTATITPVDTGATAVADSVPGSGFVASGAGMVPIPGGTYEVGNAKNDPSVAESPLQPVQLDSYYIDATEVTNEAYRRFVVERGAPTPFGWDDDVSKRERTYEAFLGGSPELAGYAVIGVSYDIATAYCRSLGKELPTESQWEVAATGVPEADGSRRIFPWGNDENVALGFSLGGAAGSIPESVSKFGVFDLAGGAFEWVKESYDTARRGAVHPRGAGRDLRLSPQEHDP